MFRQRSVVGKTTLRDAVMIADNELANDTIVFAQSLAANGPATILLTQGQMLISDSMTDPEWLITACRKSRRPCAPYRRWWRAVVVQLHGVPPPIVWPGRDTRNVAPAIRIFLRTE